MAIAGENQFSSLSGWFKELYASDAEYPVPKASWLVKNIPFNKAETGVGNNYHQPVYLTQEGGVTTAGADAGAFVLNAAIAGVMKDATIAGVQMVLRSRMDYETAARAANSKASFGSATELLVKNMMDTITKRLEIMFLYGRKGIGAVNANTTAVNTFVVSAATWAPAIWGGLEGHKIDIVLSALTNFDGAANEASNISVTSVALATRTITMGTTLSLTAGSLVFFRGAIVPGATPTYTEFLGLDAITTEATSLFGVSSATYNLWKGNSFSVGGSLTATNILNGLLDAIGKGLNEDVVLLCSHRAFQGLVNPLIDPKATTGSTNTQVGATRLDRKGGAMLELGSSGAKLLGAQGTIEVMPHLYVKDGEAFAFPKSALKRVGATDVTFNLPGRGDEFFLHVPDAAGFELRCYSNQALFTPTPAKLTKYTSIS